MCNFSESVERKATERGMAKGMAQGIEKGMAEGISKGIEQTRLSSIESLMTTMGLTVQQAMMALQIPVEEQEKYRMMLEE